jgi:hypothetical protein
MLCCKVWPLLVTLQDHCLKQGSGELSSEFLIPEAVAIDPAKFSV